MRLLLVTYEFPPKGGPGIQRPLQTARLLDKAGWDVTVLTVADPPTSLLDREAETVIPATVQVARAWSLEPTRVVQWLKHVHAGGVRGSGSARAVGYSGVPRSGVRLIQSLFFPDEKVGWIPFAIREVKRLHARSPFDVILASGPPFTALKLADKISRRFGIPWVADIRDPIVDNFVLKPLTRWHADYLRRFERDVVSRSKHTLVVSDLMRDGVIERVPGVDSKISTLVNGFDSDLFEGSVTTRDSSVFTISYVGTFQRTVNPSVFLRAVQVAKTREPFLSHDLAIRFVGAEDEQTAALVAETGNSDRVVAMGFVSHSKAIEEMRTADVLLLVLPDDPSLKPALTGKLPEYLGARKPILGLVPEGAARDVLERTGAAEIVAPNDVEAAAEALLRLHKAWRAGTLPEPDPAVVAEFDRTKLVSRLGEILEQVVNESRT